MTRDDIIRMAREAGFYNQSADYWDCTTKGIERFAVLVAAAVMKREHQWMSAVLGRFSISEETVEFIRDVIRARGEK